MSKKHLPEIFYFVLAAILIFLFALAVIYPKFQEKKTTPVEKQPPMTQPDLSSTDHYESAIQFTKEKKWDAAIESLQKAIEKDPKFTKAHYQLGMLLAQTNKIPEAISSFEVALKLEPKNKKIKQTIEFYNNYLK